MTKAEKMNEFFQGTVLSKFYSPLVIFDDHNESECTLDTSLGFDPLPYGRQSSNMN